MSHRLLVIDDETEFTAALQSLFMDAGYECVTAANGSIGIEIALGGQVDQAARGDAPVLLGVSLTTLYDKIKKLGPS